MCKFNMTLAAILFSFTIQYARADNNFCDVVLTSHAFNTYNYEYQENISQATSDLICSLHISNQNELHNHADSLSTGGQYGAVSGFLNAAQSSQNSSIENTYDRICNKHDSAFARSVFNSMQSQITDQNVQAWEKCVDKRTGLFSALKASTDNKTFNISVQYIKQEVNPPELILKGIDEKYGFDCSIDGKPIQDFAVEKNGYPSKFAITCTRPSANTNNLIAINSTLGEIGPFEVPSRAFSDLTSRVDALQQAASKQTDVSPPFHFAIEEKEKLIPYSDYKFCALTKAATATWASDGSTGYCRVSKSTNGWVVQTTPSERKLQDCEVTCWK